MVNRGPTFTQALASWPLNWWNECMRIETTELKSFFLPEYVRASIEDADWESLLALLRLLYLMYQNLHWLSRSSNFYGDHLLFQRLYESVQEDVDEFAERTVGFGKETVLALPGLGRVLMNEEATLERVMDLEMSLCAYLQALEPKADTLGLKDLFATLASRHEENLYLLKQRAESI